MRDSFIFYRSFFEATKPLAKEDKAELFDAICEYALNHEELELTGVPSAMFTLVKPQLEANYKKYLNGLKPKKESKTEAKQKQTRSKTEGNVNVNVNVNDNVNENVNVNENDILAENTIAYLNQKAKKKFGATKGNLKEIKSQIVKLKESGDDLKTIENKFAYVINVKTQEWMNVPDMKKNLNPVTLFRESNFDRYLNQDHVVTQDDIVDAVFEKMGR